MVKYCCVAMCKSKAKLGSGIRFHRFPIQKNIKRKWIIGLRIGKRLSQYASVCSLHFNSSDYQINHYTSEQSNLLKMGAVPSKNLPIQSHKTTIRSRRVISRKTLQDNRLSNINCSGLCSNLNEPVQLNISSESKLSIVVLEPIVIQPAVMANAYTQTETTKLSFSTISNHELLQFSGMDRNRFLYLFDIIVKFNKLNTIGFLSAEDMLLLLLVKYRTNNNYKTIATQFEVSRFVVSKCFVYMNDLLYSTLKAINFWKSSFNSSGAYRAIIDCTEIFVQKSQNPVHNQLTFSHYKNTTTFKILVAIDEFGLVTFVSDAYGGAISDRQIVQKSGFLNYLKADDYILADRGFDISDMLENLKVGLNIPPFLRNKKQLSEKEVMDTRYIANRRILVERVIGRAKINRIVSDTIPTYMWQYANKFIYNCFILCNFHKPLKKNLV